MMYPERGETGLSEQKSAGRLPERSALPILMDIFLVLLPGGTLLFWLLSLRGISLQRMNDLGLISVFSPTTILALAIMMISFCVSLHQARLRTPILLLHVCLLIFMLYGVTTLIEEAPRFSVVYRHAGYTEYIMRTGTIDPNLDAYFNWPTFFIASAFLTRIIGYPDILGYAVWAPVFLNLMYLAPLFTILNTFTANKRLVWLAIWCFYLTNWIGQDYYSPQGLNFFLYLVIIAILLRWFRIPAQGRHTRRGHARSRLLSLMQKSYSWLTTPEPGIAPVQPGLRRALLAITLIIFAFVVSSHPLTPFFVLASAAALVIFRRCAPFWLPVVMAIMTAAWILLMTRAFLAGHLSWVTGGIGQFASIFTSNVGSHVSGSPQHTLITELRLLATAAVWGLALVGCVWRARQGYRDANALLLASAPFSLLPVQPYGGEMLLRVYLFSLPPMTFFVAALFYPARAAVGGQSANSARPIHALAMLQTRLLATPRWKAAATTGLSILLLVSFLFTRYGNERQDYMTYAEVAGVHHLYAVAQPGSIFIEGTDGTPWQFQDYEKYNTFVLTDTLLSAVASSNAAAITQFIRHQKYTNAYLIFTRSQEATLESSFGQAPGTLYRLEQALIATGQYQLVYSNPDAQILLFKGDAEGAVSR
jgi:hypothetical protein